MYPEAKLMVYWMIYWWIILFSISIHAVNCVCLQFIRCFITKTLQLLQLAKVWFPFTSCPGVEIPAVQWFSGSPSPCRFSHLVSTLLPITRTGTKQEHSVLFLGLVISYFVLVVKLESCSVHAEYLCLFVSVWKIFSCAGPRDGHDFALNNSSALIFFICNKQSHNAVHGRCSPAPQNVWLSASLPGLMSGPFIIHALSCGQDSDVTGGPPQHSLLSTPKGSVSSWIYCCVLFLTM